MVVEVPLKGDDDSSSSRVPGRKIQKPLSRSYSADAITIRNRIKKSRAERGSNLQSSSYLLNKPGSIRRRDGHQKQLRSTRKDHIKNALFAALDGTSAETENEEKERKSHYKSLLSRPSSRGDDTESSSDEGLDEREGPLSLKREQRIKPIRRTKSLDADVGFSDFFNTDISSEIFDGKEATSVNKNEKWLQSSRKEEVNVGDQKKIEKFPQDQSGNLTPPTPLKPQSAPQIKSQDDWGMLELPISPVKPASVKKRLEGNKSSTASATAPLELSSSSDHAPAQSKKNGDSQPTMDKASRRYSCGTSFSDFEKMKMAPRNRKRDTKMPEELGLATVISGGDNCMGHRKTRSRGSSFGSSKDIDDGKIKPKVVDDGTKDYGYEEAEPDHASRSSGGSRVGRFARRFSNKSSTSGKDYGYSTAEPDIASRSGGNGPSRLARRFSKSSNSGLSQSAHTARDYGNTSKPEVDYGYGQADPDVATKNASKDYGYEEAAPDIKSEKKSRRPSLVNIVKAVQRRRSSIGGSKHDPVVTKIEKPSKTKKKGKEPKETKPKKEKKKKKKERKEDPLDAWKNPEMSSSPEVSVEGDHDSFSGAQPKRRFQRRRSAAAADYLKDSDV